MGRIKEALLSLLDMMNTVNEAVYMTGPNTLWFSGRLGAAPSLVRV